MEEDVLDKLIDWAEKYQLTIDSDEIKSYSVNNKFDFDNCLVAALSDSEEVLFSFGEQGIPAEEYLPSLVQSYFSLIKEGDINLLSVESEDDWDSAEVTFEYNGEIKTLLIPDVDASDWVPPSLSKVMFEFSKENCEARLYTINGEDPFIALYIPDTAISDLIHIRSQFPELQLNM
jgi:hypothetical protein